MRPAGTAARTTGPAALTRPPVTCAATCARYCAECAQAYAALAETTGIHITFKPNGCYGEIWTPLAKTLRPLIEAGQVQIGNHTFNH
jgi:peptidoglycan-N-acetylglucosamine deacetylase